MNNDELIKKIFDITYNIKLNAQQKIEMIKELFHNFEEK